MPALDWTAGENSTERVSRLLQTTLKRVVTTKEVSKARLVVGTLGCCEELQTVAADEDDKSHRRVRRGLDRRHCLPLAFSSWWYLPKRRQRYGFYPVHGAW